MTHGNPLFFNIDDGGLEAQVHGYRAGLLTQTDYNNLTECDNLDDMKMHLSSTDYGNFLQNEPSPLNSGVITEKATEKLVREFNELRFHAVDPLSTFLDFITYEYMIGNVLKLITAIRNGRGALELMYKCHPLGMFETIGAITAASTIDDMYEIVLADSPIGKFFTKTDKRDFDDHSTEEIRGMLYKNYLETFYDFVKKLGGVTGEIMGEILEFEADRAVLTITRQSFGGKTSKDKRKLLYPNFGELVDVQDRLSEAEDDTYLANELKPYPIFSDMLRQVSKQTSLESLLKRRAVELNKNAFNQQFSYGVFYAFVKLREQEISNLMWIAECIKQDQKHRIQEYIPIYAE
jgi:V-type H+-transporting ATPase subunit d